MNILTKNRILQEGDEMFAGGEWGKIPATEYGLQIEFSKYGKMQIRRPSEPETLNVTVEPRETPAEKLLGSSGEAAAFKPLAQSVHPAQASADWHREQLAKSKPTGAALVALPNTLPTVVSKKAHGKTAVKLPAPVIHGKEANEITLKYPDTATKGLRPPIWIGRNGTFTARGLTIMKGAGTSEGLLKFIPEGARGRARNATIEFPAEIIPQLVDFLLRHQVTPTPK